MATEFEYYVIEDGPGKWDLFVGLGEENKSVQFKLRKTDPGKQRKTKQLSPKCPVAVIHKYPADFFWLRIDGIKTVGTRNVWEFEGKVDDPRLSPSFSRFSGVYDLRKRKGTLQVSLGD